MSIDGIDIDIGDEAEERLVKGAEDCTKFFKALSSVDVHVLLDNPDYETYRDELEAVFLRVKPAQWYDSTPRTRAIHAPEIQKLIDQKEISDDYVLDPDIDLFYSRSKILETINKHPDIFSDFEPANKNLDAYLHRLFVKGQKKPEEDNRKIGVLLGYPLDAVDAYSRYQNDYFRFDEYAREHSDENPLFKQYANMSDRESGELNATRDEIRDRIRHELDVIPEFSSLSDETKDYIADERTISTRGYHFATSAQSIEYKNPNGLTFSQNIESAFSKSGIDTKAHQILEDAGWA
jgi:hypothetical protein